MVRLKGKCRAWYCAVLAAPLIVALFCECTGEGANNDMKTTIQSSTDTGGGTFPGLDEKTERQIRQDLVDYRGVDYLGQPFYTIDNVPIDYYFGTYNGCTVIAFLGDATWNEHITVADTVFSFPLAATMLAWKQGEKP